MGRLLLALGGATAVAVSFGLTIWLLARPDAGINWCGGGHRPVRHIERYVAIYEDFLFLSRDGVFSP